MSEALWSPTAQAIADSRLTQFSQRVMRETGNNFTDYNALHHWSVTAPEQFWQLAWQYFEIRASLVSEETVSQIELFPGAKWFPQSRLNYAENLLREDSDKIAFVSHLENGARREKSYHELAIETAAIAQHLKNRGIEAGDRIAGWLPNIPETAIAMLGAASLGGVWSSCSPDFGSPGALDRFGQIKPRVLFACDGYYYAGRRIDIRDKVRLVAADIPSIEQIIWIAVLNDEFELEANEALWTDALATPNDGLSFAQLPFDHPLYILYSSGTTGKPKCIVHGHGGTLIQHMKEHQLHLDLGEDDTLFFFTTCGWMMWNWLISALATRCTIVLFDGSPFHPGPETMFDLCEKEVVTVFGISAKFLGGTQKEGVRPVKTHDLAKMRMLISTGSPLTQEGFQYVYQDIKPDCHLVSMSGGTDLISCFMLGNPNLPVYEGELQSPGLGMAVDIWDDHGQSITAEKGELVCTVPFPSAPIGFWDDPNNEKFHAAYFERFENVWVHGDYAEKTLNDGYIIHGRSDAILNPGGVRIGTAEIYRQVEVFDEVIDAVCVGQEWDDDIRVILFVVLRDGTTLDTELLSRIKTQIRNFASPRHTPAKILVVTDIPRTMSGKIAELAVRDTIHGREVKNTSALANPEALKNFLGINELTS
ncbi:MAG: acetoacetate--CoA ligase [Pseudomonadales bacterium]|jgi:acetoacetyl-CoA synthetase|nr:acetoacetate--CoA ligase [Pseudomonadales bacterium]